MIEDNPDVEHATDSPEIMRDEAMRDADDDMSEDEGDEVPAGSSGNGMLHSSLSLILGTT